METSSKLRRLSSITKFEEIRRGSILGYKKVQDFFSVFLKRLSKNCVSIDQVKQAFKISSHMSVEEFIQKIKIFDDLQEPDSLLDLFKCLTKEATIDTNKFIKELKRNLESSSSESSDISSPSEGEYIEQEINPEKIEKILEVFSFKLNVSNITKTMLLNSISTFFNQPPEGKTLSKFFLIGQWRVEDGPDRNLLISFILQGRKELPVDELVLFITEKCWKVVEKEGFKGNLEDLMTECKKVDFRQTNYLNWEQLEKVLNKIGYTNCIGFKYYCFCLEQSLEHIPYEMI